MRIFSDKDFFAAKSRGLLHCRCDFCSNEFYLTKNRIQQKTARNDKKEFCSRECSRKHQIENGFAQIKCPQCKKFFQSKKSNKRIFCGQSCAGSFNNSHKTTGTRRSKLEIWLEKQLGLLYPQLEIRFNQKSAINSELDIYIPSLKLAFELNGIFHYEPIFGKDKLSEIKNNDERKFAACLENEIELCIIDSSRQKYFKEQSSQEFLKIICNLIDKKTPQPDLNWYLH